MGGVALNEPDRGEFEKVPGNTTYRRTKLFRGLPTIDFLGGGGIPAPPPILPRRLKAFPLLAGKLPLSPALRGCVLKHLHILFGE